MEPIETERLTLIPLSAPLLELLQKGRPQLEAALGLQPSGLQVSPEMEAEIDEALVFWLEFTQSYPDKYYWGTNWEIVLRSEQRAIGGIGMGGSPNRHGQVTVGYHIDPRYRRQGFGSEALRGLRDWALEQSRCTQMVAFTPIDNMPSQRVLTRCDFQKVEEVEESGMKCYFWRYPAAANG